MRTSRDYSVMLRYQRMLQDGQRSELASEALHVCHAFGFFSFVLVSSLYSLDAPVASASCTVLIDIMVFGLPLFALVLWLSRLCLGSLISKTVITSFLQGRRPQRHPRPTVSEVAIRLKTSESPCIALSGFL